VRDALDKVQKNQLERPAKEAKGRMKVVEVFSGEGAMEKLLYLVLGQLHGERAGFGVLRNFSEELSRCSDTLDRILWLR